MEVFWVNKSSNEEKTRQVSKPAWVYCAHEKYWYHFWTILTINIAITQWIKSI